jgi:F0F1-type ATP synthase assembly protein I
VRVGVTTGARQRRRNPDQLVAREAAASQPDQPKLDQPQPDQPRSDHAAAQTQRTAREADGWQILSYMLGGMILYGGIGWLVSHFTGIAVLFPVGMILGIGLSVAMIIFRFTRN